jgi:hypothetical protein
MKIYLDFAFLENFFLNPDDSDMYYLLKRLLCSAQSPAKLVVNFDFEEAYQNPEKKVIFRQIINRFPVSNLTFSDKVTTADFTKHQRQHFYLWIACKNLFLNLAAFH